MYQNLFITNRTEFEESMVYLFDDEKGLLTNPFSDFNYAYARNPRGDYVSIYGDKLQKIKRFRYDDPELFESDLSRETRVLTDLYLHDDTPSTGHKILCIDIEVSSEGGFAKPETAENEITAIAHYDYFNDQYTVFLLDKQQQLRSRKKGNETIISCGTEVELITHWLAAYHALTPTIITGWNIDGYDIPYLYNRLKRVFGQSVADSLSPIKLVKYNQYRSRYQIAGVSCLDYIELYKKFTYNQQPSYRLDAIGKYEINLGKIEYEGSLDDLYNTDIEKFLDYNLNDVKIVVGIDKKMQLIELARVICHLGHVPYEDFAYSSKFIEGTIVTYLHRKGIICANKPQGGKEAMAQKIESDEEGFAGAFVRSPMPGLYDWVYSLDLASLYPSIIMSLNISPDSKMGRVFNWDVDKHIQKAIEKYEVQIAVNTPIFMTREEFVEYIHTHKLSISSNGILYSNKKVGIIPEILNKWFQDRVDFKNMMKQYKKEGKTELAEFYDKRQHVQKILLNCFSPDTEVVTPSGIKNITTLKIGDEVYSLNPISGESEIKSVTKTYEYDYTGDMVKFKSSHVDFLTTPNHRFLLAGANTRDTFKWVLSGDVMNMKTRQYFPKKVPLPGTTYIDTVKLSNWYSGDVILKNGRIRDNRNRTKFHPNEYKIEDWLEFLGWYISEGSIYTSTAATFNSGNVRGECFSIHIAQEKHHNHVKNLLDRMGITYSENIKGFKIASKIIHNVLSNQCGSRSFNKCLPRWIFSLSPDKLEHLFRGLMMGDGNTNGQRYSTRSTNLASDVIELALRLGHQAFSAKSNDGMFRIQINKFRGIGPCIKTEYKSLVPYSGKVYCVEVADNHTLLCGRNGKYNWCGQSIYGVLGLPIFRFYDLDNALAVTATGQDVIKTTAKYVNSKYEALGASVKIDSDVNAYWELLKKNAHKKKKPIPERPNPKDHCIYIDTDSVYFSALPVMPDNVDAKLFTIKLAKAMEAGVNQFYSPMAKMMFNCDTHRFSIKGESVMETGFWVAKKRYAMKKVYDLETDSDVESVKPKVTGLDVVRSSFPPAFQKFMSANLMDILNKVPKEIVDEKVLNFRSEIRKMNFLQIARNTSVNNVSKFETVEWSNFHEFPKGATAHVKAAIAYNRLLTHFHMETQHQPIRNGDKIKWVYLRDNPWNLATVAIKTYDDPQQIIDIITEYVDYDKLFEKELANKLTDFYMALNWGSLPTEMNVLSGQFFDF